MAKPKDPKPRPGEDRAPQSSLFAQKAIVWWLPILYLLISDAFYLRTYDSAQVKITLVQMGGVCLFSLWICRLLDEGRGAFTKTDIVTLAPFLAYFAYGIFSFLHAPYTFSSLDFFLRRVFYMTVPLIVIREFNEPGISRLTRILVWATWLTVGYGFLQWFDISFFKPGIGNGPDPFIWRQAFGERVFSTFGNPNFFADFLVIIFPVLVCQYLKTREFKYVVLVVMLLWDLIATQTKGAWIGFGVSLTLLTVTALFFFDRERLARIWKGVLAGVFVLGLIILSGVVYKLSTSRWTSVNFRFFTWEGTWEMTMTQPLVGTGIGSFWVIYPAFRRPPIFHIENKHNTETDHSENEYLEVLYDEGIFGFGIFVWLALSTFVVAYRSLGQMTGSLKKGQRAPPRAYDLLGYLVALQGMLAHNSFDVSMRFVSSGIYLGLLSGTVINLSRGSSLTELHRSEPGPGGTEEPSVWAALSDFLLWPARLGAWCALAFAVYKICLHLGDVKSVGEGFAALQGPLSRMMMGGEVLQWWISWGCFVFCAASQVFIFARIAYMTRNALVPLVIVLMVFPLKLTWGFFRADVHHNIAIYFSKQQNWELALKNYLIVGELNPAFVMASYFKGNVFNDRFNMEKVYNPKWGDAGDKPRDDFERALAAYAEVRSKAPNYVQMHHQMGVLHLKRGQWERDQAAQAGQKGNTEEAVRREKESQAYLDQAIEWFKLNMAHDPVFSGNYYRIGQVHMMRAQWARERAERLAVSGRNDEAERQEREAQSYFDKAIATYRSMIDAKACEVDPKLAAKPWLRKTILAYHEWYAQPDGVWKHQHQEGQFVDGYVHLGNAYLMANRLSDAEKAYREALRLNPDSPHARQNLQVLYNRAQKMGLLKLPALPQPPVTQPAGEVETGRQLPLFQAPPPK
ncbi:MAG: O-antigen ligase family protein [Elusimicrobiota bacterium]